ncbi:hypothetical protein E4U13_006325 [Claviceps humidiphila]|uniref:P-type ATPase C-terminal domain-containing protein n=1 Tax=Claviceps humidiphila TaxID=1294629 RepID=A0A9P7PUW5_9HYPO|nr:hypothetical protein E4U13_006325 [Claviceps humidiphila]
MRSILELHHKTVITFTGFFVSVTGWFLWCLFLSGMYPLKAGKDIVRNAFLHNFGRQLSWWATLLLALAALIVMDLVVQSVRRVYWPTDQDLMQRVEKDEQARRALFEGFAGDGVAGGLACGEDIEMQDIEVGDFGADKSRGGERA